MRTHIITSLLALFAFASSAQTFTRSSFYKAFPEESLFSVDDNLKMIWDSSFREKEAYVGALLMKKAGIVGNPVDKLSLFKEGHKKLESAIQMDKMNTEYRFLRLVIQEQAPSFLGYDDEIEEDSKLVREQLRNLPKEVQEAAIDYARTSKALSNLALR